MKITLTLLILNLLCTSLIISCVSKPQSDNEVILEDMNTPAEMPDVPELEDEKVDGYVQEVKGQVFCVEGEEEKPLAKATVDLLTPKQKLESTVTDKEGRFAFNVFLKNKILYELRVTDVCGIKSQTFTLGKKSKVISVNFHLGQKTKR